MNKEVNGKTNANNVRGTTAPGCPSPEVVPNTLTLACLFQDPVV